MKITKKIRHYKTYNRAFKALSEQQIYTKLAGKMSGTTYLNSGYIPYRKEPCTVEFIEERNAWILYDFDGKQL